MLQIPVCIIKVYVYIPIFINMLNSNKFWISMEAPDFIIINRICF